MIDCYVKVDKKPDPKGDRVVLTFEYAAFPSSSFAHVNVQLAHSGKFLPYAKW